MNKTSNKLNNLCYKCTICNRSYKLNKTLRIHLNRKHGKTCFKCETSFRLYSDLKKHLEEKHGMSISEGDFPYFICKICDALFKFNKNLIVHLKVRHGVNAEVVNKLQCPICSSRFRLYKTLRAHISVNHRETTQAECYQLHSVSGSDGHVKRLDLDNIGENVPTYPIIPAIEMISHIEEIVSEGDNASDSTKIIYNKKLIYNKYTEQIKMKTDTLLELINYVELDKHKTASICNYLDMAIEELENYKNQHKQDKTFCKVSSRREQTDSVVPLRESEGLPVKVLSVNNSVLNSCNLQNTKSCFHYDHDYC